MKNGSIAWIEQLFGLQGRTWEESAFLSGKEFLATNPKAVSSKTVQADCDRLRRGSPAFLVALLWKKHLEHMALYPGMVNQLVLPEVANGNLWGAVLNTWSWLHLRP